jgi:hypothetical protein
MDTHHKSAQCKRDGTARHYTGCLWKCMKPLCEHAFDYGGTKFCVIPIKSEILKNKTKEGENVVDK